MYLQFPLRIFQYSTTNQERKKENKMTLNNKFLTTDNIQKEPVFRVYSDLNDQIDFIVLVENQEDLEKVQDIINQAWDNWWDLEENPDLQSIPVGDYIAEELTKGNVDFEIYYKK